MGGFIDIAFCFFLRWGLTFRLVHRGMKPFVGGNFQAANLHLFLSTTEEALFIEIERLRPVFSIRHPHTQPFPPFPFPFPPFPPLQTPPPP